MRYRSPDEPPLIPACPFPATRTLDPLSTPGGMLTRMVSCFGSVPRPLHCGQGARKCPSPPQAGHREENFMYPRERSTCPVPLHSWQIFGEEDGSVPLPEQTLQGTLRL